MNEWDLQSALTDQWLKKPPVIASFGRLSLVGWEIMFPSWDINYKTTRWNEPSIDFVLVTENCDFILVELKNIIPDRSRLVSAYCQVSHRADQFVRTYTKPRILKAYDQCMAGACGRFATDSLPSNRAELLDMLPVSISPHSIYRVLAAVSFPKHSQNLVDDFNQRSHLELQDKFGKPPKTSKERNRFDAMVAADYDALRTNPVTLMTVSASVDSQNPT